MKLSSKWVYHRYSFDRLPPYNYLTVMSKRAPAVTPTATRLASNLIEFNK
jgi:hypothetical protein